MSLNHLIQTIQFSKTPHFAGATALDELHKSDLSDDEQKAIEGKIEHQVAMQARRLQQLEHLRGR